MDDKNYRITRFDGAIMLLPQEIRHRICSLIRDDRAKAEEIRLRVGYAPTILLPDGEISAGGAEVTKRNIDSVLDIATRVSAYALRESMRAGYITVNGGYRIGLCGTVSSCDGQISGFRDISSLCIRISREVKGIAEPLLSKLMEKGKFESTLIISPPGGGKTTLLRDMIRLLSNGDREGRYKGYRVSLADERGEVAAMCDGVAQMDVGRHTDVLDACPKDKALLMMLRSMNPQIAAADEITAPEDSKALLKVSNCGVKLLATAHAYNVEDLLQRPLYKKLLSLKIFNYAIVIDGIGTGRNYHLFGLEGEKCLDL